MAGKNYRVYYAGTVCKAYNADSFCRTFMFKRDPGSNPTIEDGGDITLLNGDVLHINKKMGVLHPWGPDDEYEGIGLSLESGHTFITYCYIHDLDRWQESGYGCIFDYSEDALYSEGSVLKIYDIEDAHSYDLNNDYSIFNREDGMARAGIPCIGVIVIENGYWVLKPAGSSYYGSTVTLASGEKIFVSGPSLEDGSTGIYYTRDSGYGSIAYYYEDGELINHSSFGWFGKCHFPYSGCEIHIYDFGDNEYDGAIWGGQSPWEAHIDFSDEKEVATYLPKLCVLSYNEETGSWYA